MTALPFTQGPTATPEWIKQGRDYEAARSTGVPELCMLADDEPSCAECGDTGFSSMDIQDHQGITVAHEFPCDSCGRSDDFWAELANDARRGK